MADRLPGVAAEGVRDVIRDWLNHWPVPEASDDLVLKGPAVATLAKMLGLAEDRTLATTPNVWDQHRTLPLHRRSGVHYPLEKIDGGVVFFLLALEQLGARTHFSCEGHPAGFYIVMSASYKLAEQIARAGFFAVEINRRQGHHSKPGWRISIGAEKVEAWTEVDRIDALRWAAESWVRDLPLRLRPDGLLTNAEPERD